MPALAVRIALVVLDRRALQWLLWLLAAGLGVVVVFIASLGGLAGTRTSRGSSPSAIALADIPPALLAAYEAAGAKYGIDWAVIAGIGKVECDHGRLADPACRVVGAQNSAGAGGPMQFLASTWAQYGVDAAGRHVGDEKRWDSEAVVYSAANYLRASGAPGD